jgi:hypothetical protein
MDKHLDPIFLSLLSLEERDIIITRRNELTILFEETEQTFIAKQNENMLAKKNADSENLQQLDILNNKLKISAAIKINNMDCILCHEKIYIIAELKEPLHGGYSCNCGFAGKFLCLSCTRGWLQLNTPKQSRYGTIKHLICNKTFSNKNLNATKAYTVRRDLMEILDLEFPIHVVHDCGQTFTKRIAFHNHLRDRSCPNSMVKCLICEQHLKLVPDYVNHLEYHIRNDSHNGRSSSPPRSESPNYSDSDNY